MASSIGVPRHEMLSLIREVQSNQLFNRQLSSICQVNGLKSTGVKADLQRRIITLIQESSVDPSRFAQVKQSVTNAYAQRNGTATTTTTTAPITPIKSRATSSAAPNVHFSLPMPYGNGGSGMVQGFGAPRNNILTTPALAFKSSPFYLEKTIIGEVRICEGCYGPTSKYDNGSHELYTVAELAKGISTRRRIPKDSVIAELNQKAQDPDVVATSSVLSLKCPLSYMRLDVPCRGMSCSHIQCFDATSYLQLQEQGPQWLCPICNKSTPYDQLAVDEYVQDILDNTPKALEGVTIEPNGRWLLKAEEPESNNFPSEEFFDDDDDDAIEISEINTIPARPADKLPTPNTPSRQNGGGMKRPAPTVIDLTLSSDDEDDAPIERPFKRQSTVANGYHGPSSLAFPSLGSPELPHL
ncbi:Zinc finger domain-containing MIZ-type [Cordyceps militaris]|uniref:Zinc finger domain-containing MIZ-type n=1 Tax=Cordyceps militaris TaxID=73501 RepID=A0A2H4S8Y2_CORMI|nr:Zinc finger domain-containing MIZ-type [Cordyceps militaris]